jgi:hypothetical protein
MAEKLITIRGIVIPVGWDEKGEVIDAAIFTNDEDEYIIQKDLKGKELLDLIHKELEVSGFVKKVDKKKIIVVKTYAETYVEYL